MLICRNVYEHVLRTQVHMILSHYITLCVFICRNVYEHVLRTQLHRSLLEPQKKNKHISVGRCRLIHT